MLTLLIQSQIITKLLITHIAYCGNALEFWKETHPKVFASPQAPHLQLMIESGVSLPDR